MMNALLMLRKNVLDSCQRSLLLFFRTYTPHAICTQITLFRNKRSKNGLSGFAQFGIQVHNSIGGLELPYASGKFGRSRTFLNRYHL